MYSRKNTAPSRPVMALQAVLMVLISSASLRTNRPQLIVLKVSNIAHLT